MKKTVAFIFIQVVLMIATAVHANTFTDMEDNEFQACVEKLSELKIVNGDENGRFNPDDNVNRAEFSKMLVLAANYQITSNNSFVDVGENDWFFDYVTTLSDMKIISGFEDETFRPYDGITVEQAAKMLVCALEQKYDKIPSYGSGVATAFNDIEDVDAWATDYVYKAQMFGFLNRIRYNDDTAVNIPYNVNPKKELSRAEVAEIIFNFINTEEVLSDI